MFWRRINSSLQSVTHKVKNLEYEIDYIKINQGKILAELYSNKKVTKLSDVEFKIFSQFGDDGIIAYLVNHLHIPNPYFVEFGVENYSESNTRFLLMNHNWSGLVMDGSEKHMNALKGTYYYWQHDLKALAAFITRENINPILEKEAAKEIGLLHIDVDGNDYWIWENITAVDPVIVIVEYNSVFGFERPVTIPYQENFYRTNAHYSNLYWGASLPALWHLAETKGYDFVGTNSAGNNAYFVKKSLNTLTGLINPRQSFHVSKYRESLDQNGSLTFLRGDERLKAIKGMPVINVQTGESETL